MSGLLNRPFLSTNMNPNDRIRARYAWNTPGGSPYCVYRVLAGIFYTDILHVHF
ncbi:hypothetical protein BDV39DRAFT_176431 [Aspergillus sergii]|uniref:Uncharacterized protein n=1 Tax=Aspergillus sergii TaxID=1034303 RepID=A0A5N6X5U0_9EURO|nr:hypothetical protein BDV39DRAFT_176431 [Aspergillus sergii]